MEPIQLFGCGRAKPVAGRVAEEKNGKLLRLSLIALSLLIFWYAVYRQLESFSHFLTYSLIGIKTGSHLGAAVQFFVYDTPKVMMLLVLIVFLVGVLRSFFTQERTRKFLAGRREATGNVLAATLGTVTPFCLCSAVPLFLGFLQAGVPLGVTFSFLIAAPMVNEVALVLLYGLLGWKVAAIYFVSGLLIAMISGWVMGRMKLEGWIEDWVQKLRMAESAPVEERFRWQDRLQRGNEAVRDIVGKVWI